MFRSARLKLTFFYLAILLVFSLTLTIGIRALAQREYDHSDDVQRGEVHTIEQYFVGVPDMSSPMDDNFDVIQQQQAALVDQHLNLYLILLNLGALVVGGALSYWYAGRTLKPIAEAHESQRRFASDASHELRTPLANMQVENEVFLRQKTFSATEARELITSNLEEVERLENLASNLLSLTQYGQTALKLGAIPIQKVVDDVLLHAEKTFEARKVHIDKLVESSTVIGDQESVERLLSIIIDNAVKYGPEKGTIYITGRKTATHYELSIRDEGPGIDEADMLYIFDRLYRGDKARSSKMGGYGLGLALAKTIAEANHATIKAANTQHGAMFTVELGIIKK